MPGYDAFISYSHAADAQLAPALQRALQRFAKPWWRLRALTLFRDETSLAAASSLSGALLKALDSSRFFILLASPRAAGSHWCNEEVKHWLAERSADTLLIVLTEGAIAWDEAAADFDSSRTDALPPALKGTLATEPFWLDLSWARQREQVSERDPRFQQVVAKLAATLHGRGLEEISGEDVRQHRRTRRLASGAMAAIALLAVGAGVAAWEASRARGVAEASAAEAERQRAAAQKSELEARAQRDAAERALSQTLDATDALVLEIADGMKDFAGVPQARLRGVLQRAEKILDALPADSDSPAIQRRRMEMSKGFCDVLLVLGDTAQALRRATTALEIAQRQSAALPQDARWQRDLAIAWSKLGDVHGVQGDRAAAQRAYEASLKINEQLASLQPDNITLQRDLTVALSKLGDAQKAQGDLAAALRSYTAGKAICERLAERDAANPILQRDLSIALNNMGDMQAAQRDFAGAVRSFEAARAIRERLAQHDTANAAWQHDLAISYHRLGNAQASGDDMAAALRSFTAARAIFERLARSDPGNTKWQRNLSAAVENIGDVQGTQGELEAALREYEAARAILERLAQSDPGNASWQYDVFSIQFRLANILEHMPGRLGEARDAWLRAVEIITALANANRMAPAYGRYMNSAKEHLAAVEARRAKGER